MKHLSNKERNILIRETRIADTPSKISKNV